MVSFKKVFFFFLLFSFSLYFLLTGLFGNGGYFYNKTLEQQLKEMEYENDRLKTDISGLEIRSGELNTEEGIRNEAFNLGYIAEGDYVYLFDSAELQPEYGKKLKYEAVPYKTISGLSCLLISVGISAFSCLVYVFLAKRKKSEEEFSDNI